MLLRDDTGTTSIFQLGLFNKAILAELIKELPSFTGKNPAAGLVGIKGHRFLVSPEVCAFLIPTLFRPRLARSSPYWP